MRGAAGAHRAGVGHAAAASVAAVVQQLCGAPASAATCANWRTCCTARVALSDGEELQVDFAPTAGAAALRHGRRPPQRSRAAQPAALAHTVPADLQAYLDQQEREILVKALHESGFNRTAAAQRLGLSLRQIRYRIARLAIATPRRRRRR